MITATKARELMRQEGDDDILRYIEGQIIEAAKNSKNSVGIPLANLVIAERIAAALVNLGFITKTGWTIKSDPTCSLWISW